MLDPDDPSSAAQNEGCEGGNCSDNTTHIKILPSPSFTRYLGGQGGLLKGLG